jgi:hypothetical protein
LEHNTVTTFRAILSKVSGRPEECVFSNDPSAEELWTIRIIDMPDDLSGVVYFDYAGHPMATLEFTVSPDLSTFSSTGYEVLQERPLVLPGENIRKMLFDKAMPKIDEVLRNK